jgi:hypothetical protein
MLHFDSRTYATGTLIVWMVRYQRITHPTNIESVGIGIIGIISFFNAESAEVNTEVHRGFSVGG